MMVEVMRDVFQDALVSAPVEGRMTLESLPSPEHLKGKVLLKVDFLPHAWGRVHNITIFRQRTSMSQRTNLFVRQKSASTRSPLLPKRPQTQMLFKTSGTNG
jgi:phosphatidylinositol phospholipase C delta